MEVSDIEDTSGEANRKELEKLSDLNERYKQEIFDLKRKLNNALAMEREAVQQVESMQAELSKVNARGTHLPAQCRRDIAAVNEQWMEKPSSSSLHSHLLKRHRTLPCLPPVSLFIPERDDAKKLLTAQKDACSARPRRERRWWRCAAEKGEGRGSPSPCLVRRLVTLEAMEQKILIEKRTYENKIEKLEGKFAELKNVSLMDSTETVLELVKLKGSNQELVELVVGYEEKLAKERQQSASLESLVQDLSRELEVAKSNNEQKREDLSSAQEIIGNFQGEVMQLKLELESLKTADASQVKRGNSLFAEVEDRRKIMQGHLDSARTKLRNMKLALKNKDVEISKLRADKSYCSFQFKSLEKECKLTDTQWHGTYAQRIQELERTVSELRAVRQAPQLPVVGDDNFKWVSQLLAGKQADVRRLEEALEEKSMTCLMTADCLQQARRNNQTTRAELLAAKATITDLKIALLTANPGTEIDSEEIGDTAGTGLQPVDEDCQISNKENAFSADVQKYLPNEHNLTKEQSCAQIGSVVNTRRSLVPINNVITNEDSDKIYFPLL